MIPHMSVTTNKQAFDHHHSITRSFSPNLSTNVILQCYEHTISLNFLDSNCFLYQTLDVVTIDSWNIICLYPTNTLNISRPHFLPASVKHLPTSWDSPGLMCGYNSQPSFPLPSKKRNFVAMVCNPSSCGATHLAVNTGKSPPNSGWTLNVAERYP